MYTQSNSLWKLQILLKKITRYVTNVCVDQSISLRAWSKRGWWGADQAFKEEKKGQQGGSTQTVSFITQAKWTLAIHSIAFIAFPLNSKLETRTFTFAMLINTEI